MKTRIGHFFRTYALFLAAIAVVLTAIPSVYFYFQYQRLRVKLSDPNAVVQDQVNETIAKVSKLMRLPSGETPTVASVTDRDRLNQDAFFTYAQNGDIVILYQQAKKAILYRESENRIIEVATVSIGSPAAQLGGVTPAPSAPRIALYNGTTSMGLADIFGRKLKIKIPAAEITTQENAKSQTYQTSFFVDVKGTHAAEAAQYAAALGMQVGAMPAGEVPPVNADFLIIVGADQVDREIP